MDTELKCNRLTCRRPLTDKAVVTTCSHIFCVDCANELFNAARLCPACETSLTEPDDVVVCSLHPSNDYKTSVLSGLAPSTILEICNRAISFWQYQIHQENSFQQAVVRNVTDKNAQLQKQLENVVREANSEISLLGNKLNELERDLELERRKIRDLQDTGRARDKEYQKLKTQYDKIKQKALLGGNVGGQEPGTVPRQDDGAAKFAHRMYGTNTGDEIDLGAVVGDMDAHRIQRTPITTRAMGNTFVPASTAGWNQAFNPQQPRVMAQSRPQPFVPHSRSGDASESESANEVENLLMGNNNQFRRRAVNATTTTWAAPNNRKVPQNQRVFAPHSTQRTTAKFRPAGLTR